MIVDFDDFHEGQHRLDLLVQLRDANPLFRVTVFAVPAYCPAGFLDALPDWIEVAMHGWDHGGPACMDAREAEDWSYEQAVDVLLAAPARFVQGWKSPGWRISDGTYEALASLGWWVADHYENDHRRPHGIRSHVITEAAASGADPAHWHGHISDVCGNGIAETFPALLERVRAEESFEWISESVVPFVARVAA